MDIKETIEKYLNEMSKGGIPTYGHDFNVERHEITQKFEAAIILLERFAKKVGYKKSSNAVRSAINKTLSDIDDYIMANEIHKQ